MGALHAMAEVHDDPLEGTNYTAVKRLGAGGMGEVYQAVHRRLGTQVAVKIMKEQLGVRDALVDRMRLEAQAMARIDEPHVVRVFDMDVTPSGRPFYVMELLDGRPLDVEMKTRGRLPVREVRAIVLQILSGLGALHREGLIHRDVKPANVFYGHTPHHATRQVKLLDFGIVKRLETSGGVGAGLRPVALPTQAGVVMGSPNYCSPEQAKGLLSLDHRSDLYSAGVVLFMLLTGRAPFIGKTAAAVILAHLDQAPPLPSEFAPVTPELDAVVMKALAKKPGDRFQSAEEFAAALRAAPLDPLAASGENPRANGLPKTELLPATTTTPITEPLEQDTPAQRIGTPWRAPPTAPLSEEDLHSITRMSAIASVPVPSSAGRPAAVPSSAVPSSAVPPSVVRSRAVPPAPVLAAPVAATPVAAPIAQAVQRGHEASRRTPSSTRALRVARALDGRTWLWTAVAVFAVVLALTAWAAC